jgi:hypothetical protein
VVARMICEMGARSLLLRCLPFSRYLAWLLVMGLLVMEVAEAISERCTAGNFSMHVKL